MGNRTSRRLHMEVTNGPASYLSSRSYAHSPADTSRLFAKPGDAASIQCSGAKLQRLGSSNRWVWCEGCELPDTNSPAPDVLPNPIPSHWHALHESYYHSTIPTSDAEWLRKLCRWCDTDTEPRVCPASKSARLPATCAR